MADAGKEQKRSYFRNDSAYPIWYRDLSDSEAAKDWARSVTRDLSGGGASFELVDVPPALRKPGDLIEIQVIIPPVPVFALGEIVRVFRDDEGNWCAGVRFASIAPRDKDRIVRTVLAEEVGRP